MEMYQNVGKNNSLETNKTKKKKLFVWNTGKAKKTAILCRHPNTGKEVSTN